MVEEMNQVEPLEIKAVEEDTQTEQVEFTNHLTIFGDVTSYSWTHEETNDIFVKFCTFNTNIGESTYSTTVGVKEDGTPIAVISYNKDINTDIINFIVNHIIMVTCQQSNNNDELFYNKSEQNTMDTTTYNPITPVIQIVGVLHAWANLSRFEPSEENQAAEQ